MPIIFRPIFKGFTIQLDPLRDPSNPNAPTLNSPPLSEELMVQRREAVKQAAVNLFQSRCSLLLELPLQDYNYDLLELVTNELPIDQAWELTDNNGGKTGSLVSLEQGGKATRRINSPSLNLKNSTDILVERTKLLLCKSAGTTN